jgi:hypothetical protein
VEFCAELSAFLPQRHASRFYFNFFFPNSAFDTAALFPLDLVLIDLELVLFQFEIRRQPTPNHVPVCDISVRLRSRHQPRGGIQHTPFYPTHSSCCGACCWPYNPGIFDSSTSLPSHFPPTRTSFISTHLDHASSQKTWACSSYVYLSFLLRPPLTLA